MTIQINGTSGISGVDGSAGTPALQGSDSNTGISFGADTVNLITGGVTRATTDASGYFRLSGSGIQFNGDTAAANALDDYEEGTWTPTIDIGGLTTGITYSQQKGVYTKVGDVVTVGCWILLSNKGSATGTVRIDGLPFAANIPGGPINAGVLVNEASNTNWPQSTTYGLVWSDGYVYLRYNGTFNWLGIGDTNLTNSSQFYWSSTFKVS